MLALDFILQSYVVEIGSLPIAKANKVLELTLSSVRLTMHA